MTMGSLVLVSLSDVTTLTPIRKMGTGGLHFCNLKHRAIFWWSRLSSYDTEGRRAERHKVHTYVPTYEHSNYYSTCEEVWTCQISELQAGDYQNMSSNLN